MTRRRMLSLAVAAGLAMGLQAVGAVAGDEIVARFSGTGNQVTEPFTVGDGWQVKWASETHIEIILHDTAAEVPSVVANAPSPGDGKAVFARGGRFRLEIRSDAGWELEVTEEAEKTG